MTHEERWLAWAVELQSIAQCALTYCDNNFDIERFQRIREISAEILAHQTGVPAEQVREVFCGEAGYQTPKLDTRAAVFDGEKILLVRETDGQWALPGGWVDVRLSIAENTVKEVWEEAGLRVTADRIIALQDRDRHNPPVYAHKIIKVFVECTALGGGFRKNNETTASGYFSPDELPELATQKTTEAQIRLCFEAHKSPVWQARFD